MRCRCITLPEREVVGTPYIDAKLERPASRVTPEMHVAKYLLDDADRLLRIREELRPPPGGGMHGRLHYGIYSCVGCKYRILCAMKPTAKKLFRTCR